MEHLGSPDDRYHWARNAAIARGAVEGEPVTFLCGVSFIPTRDAEPFPPCETCEQFIRIELSMSSLGESLWKAIDQDPVGGV